MADGINLSARTVLFFLLFVLSGSGFAQDRNSGTSAPGKQTTSNDHRIALVIGNSAYRHAPLKNPVNDARAIAKALSGLGFEVTHLEDQTRTGLRNGVRRFGSSLRENSVALFFFAGHGMQVKGRNFLIPVDADIQTEADVEDESLDANYLMNVMEQAGSRLNLVILDACRNNPFSRKFRSGQAGLAQMDAPSGTLVAFATAPGSVASDGAGENSVYTKHLLASLTIPNLPVEQLFKRVRIAVSSETRDVQVPWESSSLRGDFYFRGGAQTDPVAAEAERRRLTQAEIEKAVREALQRETERMAAEQRTAKEATERLGREQAALAEEREALRRQRQELERLTAARDTLKTANERAAAEREAEQRRQEDAARQNADRAARERAEREAEQSRKQEAARLAAEQAALREANERAATAERATREAAERLAASQATKPKPEQLAMAAPSVAALQSSRPLRIEKPDIKIGQRWTYNYIDAWKKELQRIDEMKIVAVDNQRIEVRVTDLLTNKERGTVEFTRDWNPTKITDGRRFSPFREVFQFPLEIGKSWENESTLPSIDGGTFNYRASIRNVGWEQITVPAGSFDAVKVVVEGRYQLSVNSAWRNGPYRRTTWYSPEARAAVKWIYEDWNGARPWSKDIYELTSYKLD